MPVLPQTACPIEIDGLQVGTSQKEAVLRRFAGVVSDSVASSFHAKWHEQAGIRRYSIDTIAAGWHIGAVTPGVLIVEFLDDLLMRMEATLDPEDVPAVVAYLCEKLGEPTSADYEWYMWKDDPSMVIVQAHEANATLDMVHLDVVHWAEDRIQAEQDRKAAAS